MTEILTQPDLAEKLGRLTVDTALLAPHRRRPRSFKLGGRVVYKVEDVEQWIEAEYTTTTTRRARRLMPGNDEGRPPPGDEPAHIEALRPTEPPTSSDSTPEHRQNINHDWRQLLGRRTPELIDAALELAAQAWEIFPCRSSGPQAKSPLTIHGHHDATMDPDVIKAWWMRWPDAMIGAKVPDTLPSDRHRSAQRRRS